MKKAVFLIISLLVFPNVLWAAANGLSEQELAIQIQNRAVGTTSMQADFIRQSNYVAVGSDGAKQVQGAGKIYWAARLNLRLEQATPNKELIVADGTNVWWVRPERNRADVYPIDQFTNSLRSLLDVLGGLNGIKENFVAEPVQEQDLSNKADEATLVLRPRHPRADLSRLVLWFDESTLTLRGFRFNNVVGDSTEYRFDNVAINQALPKDFFKYRPPADYKVNDQRR